MKIEFFSKIYLAITDFRLHPFVVQREKLINSLAYFVFIILLASLVMTWNHSARFFNWVDEFLTTYNEDIEDFTISDGILDVENEIEYSLSGVQIKSDSTKVLTDVDFEEIDTDGYNLSILAFKDFFAIGSSDFGFVTSKYEGAFGDIAKQMIYQKLTNMCSSFSQKFTIIVSIWAIIFVSYLLSKSVQLVFIALMLMLLGSMFMLKYKYKHYLQSACYVLTLPIIIEVISVAVTGTIVDYATITYYLLMYVYMYYAIRALKLDNIIVTTQEKILGLKIKVDKEKTQENEENKEYDEEHDDDEYFKNTNYVEMSWDGEILSTHNKEENKDEESKEDKK